jgi:hypothetical protein
MSIETILIPAAIVLVAYIIKGATGFGENLIMIPLLLFIWDIKIILPILLVLVLIADIYLIFKFYKKINKKLLLIFVISSIGGIILGSWLLKIMSSETITIIFALFVILFSLKNLLIPNKDLKTSEVKTVPASSIGFIAGVTSSFLGAGGPPLAMYASHLKLSKSVFRATLVATFFTFDLQRLATYFYSGLIKMESSLTALLLVPSMIIGSTIGIKLHSKINENLFNKIVTIILIVTGITLLLNT